MNEQNKKEAYVIAVCGKGGVGKTAFIALVAKAIIELAPDARLLLIDADPALGLTYALGLKEERTVGSIRVELIERAAKGEPDEIDRVVQTLGTDILSAVQERDRYSLLAMGRSEAIGCFCKVNSLLRKAIAQLRNEFDWILIDAEAGLEQINRQVLDRIDDLIVLSDGSLRSDETATKVMEMLDQEIIHCTRAGVAYNRSSASKEHRGKRHLWEPIGIVPEDLLIADFDRRGESLLDMPRNAPSVEAVRRIVLARVFQLNSQKNGATLRTQKA